MPMIYDITDDDLLRVAMKSDRFHGFESVLMCLRSGKLRPPSNATRANHARLVAAADEMRRHLHIGFPPVSAPMGRVSTPLDPDTDPATLTAAGPAHEYDPGGAYWGIGAAPVWAVWVRGRSAGGICYVRARDPAAAKRTALPTLASQ